jgi:DNA-binding response OmpR family regulator
MVRTLEGTGMPHNCHTPHIAVYNDSHEILNLFEDLLASEGYRVSTAFMHTVDLDQTQRLGPDLIILDYVLAGGGDRWDLLEALRTDPATRNIPVLLCSGASLLVAQREQDLQALGVAVIPKPFDIEELLAAVAGLIIDRGSRQSPIERVDGIN